MSDITQYEAVIGLEVHAELKTQTKIFCSCPTTFGAPPNTQCCPVCLGLPGALPVLNRRVVELAVTAGLALSCDISELCQMDRKQYFYPDLPKAYQISQDHFPVCRNGTLSFMLDGKLRRVGIERIHIEEDAGKLLHEGNSTMVDCNRCGVPLIEIVSAPDLRSGAEVSAYLRELRGILLACGVSDCKMQEGSLRCDVNLSIRRVGETGMGTRTEIKNLNSFAFAEKAVAWEVGRQIRELEETGQVCRRTMRYDAAAGKTIPMRGKEQAADYRFFPEPDILPFRISRETVERLRRELPELPAALRERLQKTYGMTAEEAEILTSAPGLAEYYETVAKQCRYPLIALRFLLNDLLRLCTGEQFLSPIAPQRLAELAELTGDRTVNRSTAKKLLLRLAEQDASPREIAEREGLTQIVDPELISGWIAEILASDTRSAADYRNGKINALRALQGQLMAKSRGRADPVLAEQLLLAALKQ